MLQYIGARYVPIFYQNSLDPTSTDWEPNVPYEPMVWVSMANGDMYLSKKKVPANAGDPANTPEYWMAAGQFNAYINSLQSQINALNAQINDTDGIADQVNEATDYISRLKNRKFVFIGDSYMTGESAGGVVINSFTHYFGVYTGLTANTDYYVSAHSGYGFKNGEFTSLLNSVISSLNNDEKAAITDIVVLGGINDNALIVSDFNDFENRMQTFINTAKSAFPNATVKVGYISKDYTGRFDIIKRGVMAYKIANRNGALYLNGVENILRSLDQFLSDGHPSAEGQKALGRYIIDALFSGITEPAYDSREVHIVPQSGITITANLMVCSSSNGSVTISSTDWSKFSFASRSFTSPVDGLYIGDMDSGLLIGASDSPKYIPVTIIVVGDNNAQLEGKLLFNNKKVYLYPWQQLNVLTGVTELRIAPFTHTMNTADI